MLSDSTVLALQKIVHEEYGREITFDEATEVADVLVTYFDTLGRLYFEIKNENHES